MARIVRTDRELEMPRLDAALRAAGHELVLLPDGVSEDELVRALGDAELLLMCYTPITARVIGAALRLKGIVKYGVGIDAIDIEAAMARGIAVANVPEYAEQTVAEGAFALLMVLAKKLKPMQGAMAADGWIWPSAAWLGSDLGGKTLGLVGVGRIGVNMARMAQAFRMRVVGFDPYAVFPAGVEKRNHLQDMLAECDVVSIHCVLNPQTRHLIGEAELRAMKPSAFLVNVSRGAIVDESAVIEALEQGRLAGAGLDVYPEEPRINPRLLALPNVVLLPHIGSATHEARVKMGMMVLENITAVLAGREAPNRVGSA